jgi:hypothetical protein
MPEFGGQESQFVTCRIASRHAVLRVLVGHIGPPPEAPLAESSVSEVCLETCMNIFGRGALFAEKPTDDFLVGLHPLKEKL